MSLQVSGAHHSLVWLDLLYVSVEKPDGDGPPVGTDLLLRPAGEGDECPPVAQCLLPLWTHTMLLVRADARLPVVYFLSNPFPCLSAAGMAVLFP